MKVFQGTFIVCRYTSEKKKYQKAALGLQDSDEDDHEQVAETDGHNNDDVDDRDDIDIDIVLQEIDAQIENLLSAKRTVKAMDGTST